MASEGFFLLLLGVSLVVILLTVLSRGKRKGAEQPPAAGKSKTAMLKSPVWNVVGALAGVISAAVAVIGLFK